MHILGFVRLIQTFTDPDKDRSRQVYISKTVLQYASAVP